MKNREKKLTSHCGPLCLHRNQAFSAHFLEALQLYKTLSLKMQQQKIKKPSEVLFPVILYPSTPLLAKLQLKQCFGSAFV
jgi:hypothetical protein